MTFSRKWLRTAAAGLLGSGSMAMGALYTWDGGASGDWSDQTQWSTLFCGQQNCYPRTTDDDACIVEDAATVTLTESLEIDDLSLTCTLCETLGVQTFTTDDSLTPLTITADSITISGNTRITVEKRAGLIADGTDPCAAP